MKNLYKVKLIKLGDLFVCKTHVSLFTILKTTLCYERLHFFSKASQGPALTVKVKTFPCLCRNPKREYSVARGNVQL